MLERKLTLEEREKEQNEKFAQMSKTLGRLDNDQNLIAIISEFSEEEKSDKEAIEKINKEESTVEWNSYSY